MSQIAEYEAESWAVFEQFNEAVTFGPASPYPEFHRLRREAAVHPGVPHLGVTAQDPAQPPTFSVFGYDAATTVLRDTETYSNSAYHPLIGDVMGRTLIEMDPPEHRGYRMMLQHALSPKAMVGWKTDLAEPLAADMIARIRDRGRGDLVRDVLFAFPMRTFAAMLGLPPDQFPVFHRYAIEVIAMTNDMARAHVASAALGQMIGHVLDERRKAPKDDLISVLAEATHDGQRLTDEEIFSFLRLLLPAGAETTYRSSSSLLVALLTQPDQLALIREEPELLGAAMNEAFRWETPLLFAPRLAVRNSVLDGVEIPAGSTIIVNLGAANRDPSRWPDPDRFDLTRERQPHVGFGHGSHLCIGQHLAKMETEVLVRTLLAGLPGLRLDPDVEPPAIVGTLMRSPARLDVTWEV
jgi:cytochrome P450